MSNVKLFVVFKPNSTKGYLTKFFSGCTAYHIGFVVPESNFIYDMSLFFRRVVFNGKYHEDQIVMFDLPEGVTLTEQDLTQEIFDGVEALCTGSMLSNFYGFLDYAMFSVRGIYHFFGKSTPNFGGVICSEKINDILVKKGWISPFTEVPSPCDFVRHFAINETEFVPE
jgi:hypothetical protein